jgi:hypothetical protein
MPSVVRISVIMVSAFIAMLSVFMPSAFMLSVVVPLTKLLKMSLILLLKIPKHESFNQRRRLSMVDLFF